MGATDSAIARSSGIVIGRVQKLTRGRQRIPEYSVEVSNLNGECERLAQAIDAAADLLAAECDKLAQFPSRDPILLLQTHRALLLDPELKAGAERFIRNQLINAEWALRKHLDHVAAIFDTIEDPYLRARKADVEQVGERILDRLLGEAPLDIAVDAGVQILVGEDFSPPDVVEMWQQGVNGFITEQGGVNSHSIIVARGIGMPALVGAESILDLVEDGDVIILDAETGDWFVNPDAKVLHEYEHHLLLLEDKRRQLTRYATETSRSHNGRAMPIMANLEFKEEVMLARDVGAEGVGLYRTEFLFLNALEMPDEEEQYQHYRHVVEGMEGRTVTFRLLDIGGDKLGLFHQLSGKDFAGENPALGMRGIRLLLQWPDVLRTQVRALLRAAEHGPVQLLIPMVTVVEELFQVRAMVKRCAEELSLADQLLIGVMIEVPAAVLIADQLAQHADFFSIGTNDLIQYTLAADRCDEDVANMYQDSHPAIRKLIQWTVDAGNSAGIPVSVCGELASDPKWTQDFLDMGMHALSMSANHVLNIRQHLSALSYRERQ
ncbi:MAG: phosphoenolpyruvate--protein phosphotransferase [Zetaproteobacteria bacterium]|nr:phosphoenolpyruvate--protein phosphotransferase [Zetaproteobacteria bacterium]